MNGPSVIAAQVLATVATLVIVVAALTLAWHEVSLVRDRNQAARFDRAYQENLEQRSWWSRT